MGTKVEGKSYLPGFFAMRDPNFSSNSDWSRYYEEKTSSGPPDDWFMSGPASGYSEYDKEMLKRTMLEHEAIFRKQVMVRASTLRSTVGSRASSPSATTTPSHVGPSSIRADLPSSSLDTAGTLLMTPERRRAIWAIYGCHIILQGKHPRK